jgi:serine protease
MFDIRPVNVSTYLARSFFPDDDRPQRNVLIDNSSFDLPVGGKLSLTGILRHELGHTLGARHEQTRPQAGTCFEDKDWRGVTDYDALSVMHYPQCNGKGDWSLTLTKQDKNGIACLYGPAPGFTIDPNICKPKQ